MPAPPLGSLCVSVKTRLGDSNYRAWFPGSLSPFSCRSVIIIISIGRLGRLGCGRLLSNFFPSDYKGCVNKRSAIDSHQSMHRPRGSRSQFPAAAARSAAGGTRPGSAENKLNHRQLFLFLPSLLMDGMGLVYQEEEKLIDTGFNVIMPGLSGHISSFLILFYFFYFLKGILLPFTGPAAKTIGINKKAGA